MSERVEILVPAEGGGARLDAFLAADPRVGSRGAAERLIGAGRVTVDGERRPKRHRLAGGERVLVAGAPLGEAAPAAAAAPHRVVCEDDHLIVVDKPAGVVVHPSPGHPQGTLAQALAERAAGGSEGSRRGIVHRLDRDTSGLLVVAKSEEAHAALGALIRSRAMKREYLALVDGRPSARSGTIEAPIGRDRVRRTVVSTRTDRPREARTHFRQLEPLALTTLLEVRLETGRTHQIRSHLAAIGHPVCGDPSYGGAACGARLGLRRQFLHSARVSFRHPLAGREVAVESALPADLEAALDAARAESR